jgi:putative Holliday junction resolvase
MGQREQTGCIVGVDFGLKRLGIAVSDHLRMIAMPLEVVEVADERAAVEAVAGACRGRDPSMIVVGLPLNMNGTPGPMSQKVDAFVAKLRERMGVPVITWDERLSTMMAERVLLEADMSRRRRKAVRDKVAAQVILQGFLDSLSAGATYDAL